MVNMKNYLLTGTFQPYAMVGVGLLDAEVSIRDAVALGVSVSEDEIALVWQVGGGVDVYANENWVVSLEGAYVVPTSDLDELDFWTLGIGLQYRF